jgi:hypothetical protein
MAGGCGTPVASCSVFDGQAVLLVFGVIIKTLDEFRAKEVPVIFRAGCQGVAGCDKSG